MRYFPNRSRCCFWKSSAAAQRVTPPLRPTRRPTPLQKAAPKGSSLDDYNAKFKPLADAIDAAMKDSVQAGSPKGRGDCQPDQG